MSKAALVSFIIDLKLDREGKVKILEFGDLYLSGYSGYTRLTGRSPLKEKVFPFYEEFGLPVFQSGDIRDHDYVHPGALTDKLGILPLSPGSNFRPQSLQSHAAILSHSEFADERTRRALQTPPYDQVIATNVNGLINGCFLDKAFLAAFGQRFAPDLFPKQKIYPVGARGRVDIGSILADFPDSKIVVLKNTWEAQADGVDIVRRSRLNLAFNLQAGNTYLRLFKKPDLKHDDVCVVQDFVPGTLIPATNAYGAEGQYDPTMRVILSAWHDEGQTRIRCHDAYYKVPSAPARETAGRKTAISKVHDDTGPQSALVPDDHKAAVFAQLETGLPALMHGLFSTPSHQFAREFLDSEDEALRRIGRHIATNALYFDRPETEEAYPADVAERVFAMRDKTKSVFSALKHRNIPEGLPQTLYALAENEGENPGMPRRFSLGKAALLAAAGLVAGMLYVGGEDESARLEAALKLFAEDYRGPSLAELPNLRIAGFSQPHYPDFGRLAAAIGERAQAQGYELCHSGRWSNPAQRLFPAFTLAMQNPDHRYLKVDFERTERLEKDGMVISEESVVDTAIYGTACPGNPRLD